MEACYLKNFESFLADYETNRDFLEPLENLNRDLKIELAKYKRAYEAVIQLHRSLNSSLVARSILDVVSSLFFIGSAAVIRFEPDKKVKVLAGHNISREMVEEMLGHIEAMINEIRISRRPVIVADSLKDKTLNLISRDFPSIGLIPMILGHEALGAILINNWAEGSFSGAILDVLNLVASSAAVALQNAENFEATRRCIFIDPETGVYNRKYFHDYLKHFLAQQKTCPIPNSILLLSLKNYRDLEARWGRQFPITVLQRAADQLTQQLKRSPILCRYNTSTLVGIFPGVEEKDLPSITEEVERVSTLGFESLIRQTGKRPNLFVTVSGFFLHSELDSVKAVIRLVEQSLNRNGSKQVSSIGDEEKEKRAGTFSATVELMGFREAVGSQGGVNHGQKVISYSESNN
jgi:diguanylate cyclase (GGDEF)-like protein